MAQPWSYCTRSWRYRRLLHQLCRSNSSINFADPTSADAERVTSTRVDSSGTRRSYSALRSKR
eukprot:6977326-Pyramimonas_sp.AAC.1